MQIELVIEVVEGIGVKLVVLVLGLLYVGVVFVVEGVDDVEIVVDGQWLFGEIVVEFDIGFFVCFFVGVQVIEFVVEFGVCVGEIVMQSQFGQFECIGVLFEVEQFVLQYGIVDVVRMFDLVFIFEGDQFLYLIVDLVMEN